MMYRRFWEAGFLSKFGGDKCEVQDDGNKENVIAKNSNFIFVYENELCAENAGEHEGGENNLNNEDEPLPAPNKHKLDEPPPPPKKQKTDW